jgi:hypothetical protein
MVTKHGDSCFYIFIETGYETNSNPYFKIGIVLHSTTDEGVKNWDKYVLSPHPISITRRLAKLNNGNPREIIPIAYFRCETDNQLLTAKQKTNVIEQKWLKYLQTNARLTSSKEWFQLEKQDFESLVKKIVHEESDKYTDIWISDILE